jgi:acetyl-CoA acyltransferase
VARQLREVVFVDGVRTPFGKAKGQYAETRADDLVIKCIRELMRRNPDLPPERVDEVAIAATTQIGDQGLTIGRTAALLAGLPRSVPGYAIDRMCAGAMTAVTTTASGIAFGAYDVVIAGGVEHMGRHPMGEGVDPNPRIVSEKIVDPEALSMGNTAENLHDRYPTITKDRADAYAVRSQEKTAQAYADGRIQPDLVPVATRSAEAGWGLATTDEPPRPGTTLEDLAALKTPFRSHGRVTAGNSAGINDGATAALLADEETARELGLPVKMRLVAYSFTGVEPEVMGAGPIPATEKALARAGLTIDGCTSAMSVTRNESFGPVLTVETFSDEDEAVAIANDSIYGLAGAVWTQDAGKAQRVAGRLRMGTVWINDYHPYVPQAEWGGYKQSGIGRELGVAGLDEYRETKHVWHNIRPTAQHWFGDASSLGSSTQGLEG